MKVYPRPHVHDTFPAERCTSSVSTPARLSEKQKVRRPLARLSPCLSRKPQVLLTPAAPAGAARRPARRHGAEEAPRHTAQNAAVTTHQRPHSRMPAGSAEQSLGHRTTGPTPDQQATRARATERATDAPNKTPLTARRAARLQGASLRLPQRVQTQTSPIRLLSWLLGGCQALSLLSVLTLPNGFLLPETIRDPLPTAAHLSRGEVRVPQGIKGYRLTRSPLWLPRSGEGSHR